MLVTVTHNEVQKQRMKSAFIASKTNLPRIHALVAPDARLAMPDWCLSLDFLLSGQPGPGRQVWDMWFITSDTLNIFKSSTFFCCETSSGFRCAPTNSSFLFVLKQFALAALLLTSLITLGCHHTHTHLSLSLLLYVYICTCMDMHPFVYIVFWGFPWCMWANLYGMN